MEYHYVWVLDIRNAARNKLMRDPFLVYFSVFSVFYKKMPNRVTNVGLEPSAGANSTAGLGGTSKECLTFTARPGTPEEIRKFRRSANLEPGKRFVHPGVADDFQV